MFDLPKKKNIESWNAWAVQAGEIRWALEHSLELDRNHSNLSKTKYSTNKRKKIRDYNRTPNKKKKTPPLLRMRLALLRHRLFGILLLSLRGSVEKITTLSRHSLSAKMKTQGSKVSYFPASGIWSMAQNARVKNAAENPVSQCADAPPPWLAVGKPIVFGVALQQVMLLRITQCWFTNHFQISNSITANPCISMRKSQTWSLLIGDTPMFHFVVGCLHEKNMDFLTNQPELTKIKHNQP